MDSLLLATISLAISSFALGFNLGVSAGRKAALAKNEGGEA